MPVPAGLATVLAEALAIGEASGGAFDIGVGDLVVAWGFGGGRRTPDPELIGAAAARPSVQTHKTLQLDRRAGRARKLAPLTLDLSGIAKGFGVDELGAGDGGGRASTHGSSASTARCARPDASRTGAPGRSATRGPIPRSARWPVSWSSRTPPSPPPAPTGTRRSGTGAPSPTPWIPRTGAPIGGGLASVTVVAPDCMAADAWATALMVAGADRAAALARAHGLSYVMALADGTVQTSL